MLSDRLESSEPLDELGIELTDEELSTIHGADGLYPPQDGTGQTGGDDIPPPPPEIPLQ